MCNANSLAGGVIKRWGRIQFMIRNFENEYIIIVPGILARSMDQIIQHNKHYIRVRWTSRTCLLAYFFNRIGHQVSHPAAFLKAWLKTPTMQWVKRSYNAFNLLFIPLLIWFSLMEPKKNDSSIQEQKKEVSQVNYGEKYSHISEDRANTHIKII